MKRIVFFLICITVCGLVTVFEEIEAVKVGYLIRKQEEAKVLALDRRRTLQYNMACLKAPLALEERLAAQHIQLAAPRAWQTLDLNGQRPVNAVSRQTPGGWGQQFFLSRFFVGTAQAEAKEPSQR